MNKKEVLKGLLVIANKLDANGDYISADALTEVCKRLRVAQWDDGGDYHEPYYDELGEHEQNELMRDRYLDEQDDDDDEDEDDANQFPDVEMAVADIHSKQVNGMNEKFFVFSNNDTGTFYIMPESAHAELGSDGQWVKTVEPMSRQELAAYVEHQQQEYEDFPKETPFGMEIDDTPDPMHY